MSAAVNGGTHMAFEDIGVLRSIVGIRIIEPTDNVMMRALIPQIAGEYGVDYIRMPRRSVVKIYDAGESFTPGEAKRLREGSDVTIIASGVLVSEALIAAELLANEGIEASVLWLTRCTAQMLENVAPVVLYRDGKVTEFWDVPSDWLDAFIHSTIDFIESVRDHREPVLSGERGREVLAFALAALASSEQKKEIYLTELTDRKKQKRRGVLSIFGKKKG